MCGGRDGMMTGKGGGCDIGGTQYGGGNGWK